MSYMNKVTNGASVSRKESSSSSISTNPPSPSRPPSSILGAIAGNIEYAAGIILYHAFGVRVGEYGSLKSDDEILREQKRSDAAVESARRFLEERGLKDKITPRLPETNATQTFRAVSGVKTQITPEPRIDPLQ